MGKFILDFSYLEKPGMGKFILDFSYLEKPGLGKFILDFSYLKKPGMGKFILDISSKKYHASAPMGRSQLESIYLYFPPSSHLLINIIAGTTVENKGKLILVDIS